MALKAYATHPWNQCYPWSIPLPFLTTDISDDTDLVRADGAARLFVGPPLRRRTPFVVPESKSSLENQTLHVRRREIRRKTFQKTLW